MLTTMDKVKAWLQTFSPVQTIAENPDAMAKEIDTIADVFMRENATSAMIDDTFKAVKMGLESRAWPTAAQVYTALRQVRRVSSGEVQIGTQRGDRSKLFGPDLQRLEMVLLTYRRWLREFPNLRHHAISTLEYWSEPIVDDRGRQYAAQGKR